MGCVQGSHKLERSGLREKLLLLSLQATPFQFAEIFSELVLLSVARVPGFAGSFALRSHDSNEA
jgi:hypothetical protein